MAPEQEKRTGGHQTATMTEVAIRPTLGPDDGGLFFLD